MPSSHNTRSLLIHSCQPFGLECPHSTLYLCSCSWLCFLALSPESFFPRSMGTSPWVTYSFNTHKLITHFEQKTMQHIVEWGEPKKYTSKMPSPGSQRWGNHRRSWRTAQCQQRWALQLMPSAAWTNRRLRTNRRKYSYRRGSKRLLGDVRRGQKCVWELDIQQLDGVLRIQNIPLVTEDHVLYDPRIIWNVPKRQIYRNRKEIIECLELRGNGCRRWGLIANEYNGTVKAVLRLWWWFHNSKYTTE